MARSGGGRHCRLSVHPSVRGRTGREPAATGQPHLQREPRQPGRSRFVVWHFAQCPSRTPGVGGRGGTVTFASRVKCHPAEPPCRTSLPAMNWAAGPEHGVDGEPTAGTPPCLGAAEQELRGEMPVYPSIAAPGHTECLPCPEGFPISSQNISTNNNRLVFTASLVVSTPSRRFPLGSKTQADPGRRGAHSPALNHPLPSSKRPKQGTCTQRVIPGSSAALAAQSHPPQAPETRP